MQQWEYKVVAVDAEEGERGVFRRGGAIDAAATERRLAELGSSGWELVSAFDTNAGHGASRNYVFVLKRPKA